MEDLDLSIGALLYEGIRIHSPVNLCNSLLKGRRI